MYRFQMAVFALAEQALVSRRLVLLYESGLNCDGSDSPPVVALIQLIEQLRLLGLEIAFPGAALGYTVAGLLWQTGSPKNQRQARRLFTSVTVGLIAVILAKPAVQFLEATLCGGGA